MENFKSHMDTQVYMTINKAMLVHSSLQGGNSNPKQSGYPEITLQGVFF